MRQQFDYSHRGEARQRASFRQELTRYMARWIRIIDRESWIDGESCFSRMSRSRDVDVTSYSINKHVCLSVGRTSR